MRKTHYLFFTVGITVIINLITRFNTITAITKPQIKMLAHTNRTAAHIMINSSMLHLLHVISLVANATVSNKELIQVLVYKHVVPVIWAVVVE